MSLTDLGMGRRTILAMASCSSDSSFIASTGVGGYSDSGIEDGSFQVASGRFWWRGHDGRVLRHMVHYCMGRDLKFVYRG